MADTPPGTIRWLLSAVAVVAIVVWGWQTVSDDSDAGDPTLAEAFCSDLEAGLTPYQILYPRVADGTWTPQAAANQAHTYASTSCPDQLATNEGLRGYLEGFGITPDP